MKKVMIFYEDSGAERGFALHSLILACVADRLGLASYWALKSVFAANPRNGRDNVLASCRDDAWGAEYWGGIGVVDGDEIHLPLGLPSSACKVDLRRAFETRFGHPRTALFVIDSNTETILEAVAKELPGTAVNLERAVRLKKRLERDRMLAAAADAPPSVRDGVLSRVGSLKRLVDKLACAYTVWSAADR